MFHLNNKRYVLREENGKAGLMSDSSTGEVFVLNPVAMYVMLLLRDEPHELEVIVARVHASFTGAAQETVRAEVEAFLSDAVSRGFLDQDGKNPAKPV